MEKILGLLEHVSGHTFDILYDLLFTSERVIALMIHHPADEPLKIGFSELLLGGRPARQRKLLDHQKSPGERLLAYQQRALEALLADHRFNYDIPYPAIKTVEIVRGLFQSRLHFHLADYSTVRSSQFTLAKNQVSLAQDLITRVLPSKVKK